MPKTTWLGRWHTRPLALSVWTYPAGDIRRDAEIWKAVEQMKNGYLWDKRHHWQEAYIMPPKVLVLTNDEPDRTMLSRDRWDIGYLDYGISNWANTIKWERGDSEWDPRYRVTLGPIHYYYSLPARVPRDYE